MSDKYLQVKKVVLAHYPESGKQEEHYIANAIKSKVFSGYDYYTGAIGSSLHIYIGPTDASENVVLDGTTLYRYAYTSKAEYDNAAKKSGGASSSLEKYTVKVLKEKAKKKSIPRYSTMKKSELIRALRR